jgi:hypothetical protein
MRNFKVSKGELRAFPKGQSDYTENRGMTVRQYYAAHSGISLEDALISLNDASELGERQFPTRMLVAEMVRLRFEYADAMIAAETGQ